MRKNNTQIFKFFCPSFLLRKEGEVKGEKPLSPFANGETSPVATRKPRNSSALPLTHHRIHKLLRNARTASALGKRKRLGTNRKRRFVNR